jgi:hypothetical protein
LVLFDVYVRSCLTFAAPVWAPLALVKAFPGEASGLSSLHVLHRRGLRAMMGAPHDVRNAVLYATACRAPLTLPLAKATWRYYQRLALESDDTYLSTICLV